MTGSEAPSQGPRPLAAFFLSLAGSSVLLGLLLLSDRRVLELKRARAEIRQLDQQIADRRRENEELKTAVEAANRHEFPAERVAREELHLVHPEDIVLSFPPGSLTGGKTMPTPAAGAPASPKAPPPR
jgi:cell division protein FtsB